MDVAIAEDNDSGKLLKEPDSLHLAGEDLADDYNAFRVDADLRLRPKIDCNRCAAPGTCCKAIPISMTFDDTISSLSEVAKQLTERSIGGGGFHGLHPFVPLRPADPIGAGSRRWLWECLALGKDGRCTMYEDRPDMCREYEPGSDNLCIHVRGVDGNPIVPQKEG